MWAAFVVDHVAGVHDEDFVVERDISFEDDTDDLFSDTFDVVVVECIWNFVAFHRP